MNEPDRVEPERVDCFVKRLFSCAPEDAAERVLAGLDPAKVDCALYWGEVQRVARCAVLWSALGALLGVGALVASFVHGGGPAFKWSIHHAPGAHGHSSSGEGDAFAFVPGDERRRLADPFLRAPLLPEKR